MDFVCVFSGAPGFNQLYVRHCDADSFTVIWGDLSSGYSYILGISPNPTGSAGLYRVGISANNRFHDVNNLRSGHEYTVTLLRISQSTSDELDSIQVFTSECFGSIVIHIYLNALN